MEGLCGNELNFESFQLRAYFTQWGPVVDAIVIRDPTTKQSRGFGFVTFATIASLEAAMMDRPHVIAGKTVISLRQSIFFLFLTRCNLPVMR